MEVENRAFYASRLVARSGVSRDAVFSAKLFREVGLFSVRARPSNALLFGDSHNFISSQPLLHNSTVSVFFIVAGQSTPTRPRASIIIYISSSCICSKLWYSSVGPAHHSNQQLQATRAAKILSLNDEKEHPGHLLPALPSCLLQQPIQLVLWLLPSWRRATDRLSSTYKVSVFRKQNNRNQKSS
jgi:hypothetical protein